MTSDKREKLMAEVADAQGLGDHDRVRDLLEQLQKLDKPERAVPRKRTETRKKS